MTGGGKQLTLGKGEKPRAKLWHINCIIRQARIYGHGFFKTSERKTFCFLHICKLCLYSIVYYT